MSWVMLAVVLVALLVWRVDERRLRMRERRIERAWVEHIEIRTHVVHDAALKVLERHGEIMLEGLQTIARISEKMVAARERAMGEDKPG